MTGTELAAARKAAEFARQDLAKKLNLNRTTVYRWETGKVKIPPAAQVALRRILRDTLPQPYPA